MNTKKLLFYSTLYTYASHYVVYSFVSPKPTVPSYHVTTPPHLHSLAPADTAATDVFLLTTGLKDFVGTNALQNFVLGSGAILFSGFAVVFLFLASIASQLVAFWEPVATYVESQDDDRVDQLADFLVVICSTYKGNTFSADPFYEALSTSNSTFIDDNLLGLLVDRLVVAEKRYMKFLGNTAPDLQDTFREEQYLSSTFDSLAKDIKPIIQELFPDHFAALRSQESISLIQYLITLETTDPATLEKIFAKTGWNFVDYALQKVQQARASMAANTTTCSTTAAPG